MHALTQRPRTVPARQAFQVPSRPSSYGGSGGPQGPDHFDGGLNTGHFDGSATKGPDLGGRDLTARPLGVPLRRGDRNLTAQPQGGPLTALRGPCKGHSESQAPLYFDGISTKGPLPDRAACGFDGGPTCRRTPYLTGGASRDWGPFLTSVQPREGWASTTTTE